MAASPDGKNWITVDNGIAAANVNTRSVAYGAGRFVAVGDYGAITITQPTP
jgi:hypothetical protein